MIIFSQLQFSVQFKFSLNLFQFITIIILFDYY